MQVLEFKIYINDLGIHFGKKIIFFKGTEFETMIFFQNVDNR